MWATRFSVKRLAKLLFVGGGLRFEFAGYGVENAIDELDGFGSGEAASDFERFVDDDRARRLGEAEEFGDSGAQDIAIDGGHAFEAPMFGVAFEELADLVVALHCNPEDIVSEVADTIFEVAALSPKSFLYVLDRLFTHVGLKQHLQRQFA